MPDAASDPRDRFTGLATAYARGRPSYPDAAVQAIIDRVRLGSASLLVDVGCGTGIATRLFAARGVPVIGLEPNDDMRRQAENAPAPPGPRPEYRAGRAEATGLPKGMADAVLVAQAFHWFEPEVALREFHRILKPDGWLALIWNERDETDPFTAAYGAIIRTWPEAEAHETTRAQAGDVLATHPLFTDYERLTFANRQLLDLEGLRGRMFSVSYAPPDQAGRDAWSSALDALFARYQRGGWVELCYVTTLHMARQRSVAT